MSGCADVDAVAPLPNLRVHADDAHHVCVDDRVAWLRVCDFFQSRHLRAIA